MRALTFLAIVALAVMARPAFAELELSPGDQAQVSEVLDRVHGGLDEITQYYQGKINKHTGDLTKLANVAKWTSIVSKVGKALQVVSAIASVASVIFTFFMPSELEVILDKFKEADAKVNILDKKLDAMEKAIKTNTEFNVFLSVFISWKLDLENGDKQLKDVRAAMLKTSETTDRHRLALKFINFYEFNKLEGNTENIFKMVAHPESELHRNILDRFIEEKGCDVLMLSMLMVKIQRIMISAAVQKLAYYNFKGNTYRTLAIGAWRDIRTQFYAMRRAFNERTWKCRRDAKHNAYKDVQKLVRRADINDVRPEAVVEVVYKHLTERYPQYVWAVGMTKSDGSDTRWPWQGLNYFTVDAGTDRKLILALEDPDVHIECSDFWKTKTRVIFKPCESCNEMSVRAAPNFATIDKCGQGMFEWTPQRNPSYYVIATALNHDKNECLTPNKCNNHGQCHAIRFTTDVQCICSANWAGDYCDQNDTADESALKLLCNSRGVPDIISTYNLVLNVSKQIEGVSKHIEGVISKHFEDLYENLDGISKNISKGIDGINKNIGGVSKQIKGISDQLSALSEDNHLSDAQTRNLIKHSDTIRKVEFVVKVFQQKQRGEIDFGEFGGRLYNYFTAVTTPYELMHNLKSMIVGEGTLETPGEDIVDVYKKAYAAKYTDSLCSNASYNHDVANMIDTLSYLDYTLGEALIHFKQWYVETSARNVSRRVIYLSDAETIKARFVPRQKLYYEYWSRHSCGTLRIEGTHVDCQEMLTYTGLTISPSCSQQRVISESSVTCQRTTGGDLQWSSQPTCKYVWSSFGSFGACSKTCGGGTRRAFRTCLGTSDVENCIRDAGGKNYKEERCNTNTCPHWSSFGSFGTCSKTCGGGIRRAYRTCVGTGNVNICIRDAGGRNYKEQRCNTNTCPYWSSFGSFGACSKTCGGGTKTANRRCVGGSSYVCRRDRGGLEYKRESCNTHRCCSDQSDKYECSNGKCIPRSYLCDSDNDCGNNDDESRRNCPNALRSHSKMALRNIERTNHWLSCNDDTCDLKNCPGSSFSTYEWENRCSGEKFYIEAVGKPSGSIIKNDAMVRFNKASTNYLSCGSVTKKLVWARWRTPRCTVQDNWGQQSLKFRIRKSYGSAYVRTDDAVYIKSVQFGYWLGGSRYDGVNLRPCRDLPGCVEEKWRLHVRT